MGRPHHEVLPEGRDEGPFARQCRWRRKAARAAGHPRVAAGHLAQPLEHRLELVDVRSRYGGRRGRSTEDPNPLHGSGGHSAGGCKLLEVRPLAVRGTRERPGPPLPQRLSLGSRSERPPDVRPDVDRAVQRPVWPLEQGHVVRESAGDGGRDEPVDAGFGSVAACFFPGDSRRRGPFARREHGRAASCVFGVAAEPAVRPSEGQQGLSVSLQQSDNRPLGARPGLVGVLPRLGHSVRRRRLG